MIDAPISPSTASPRPQHRGRHLASVAGLALLAGSLAACGSSSKAAAGSPTTTGHAPAPASAATISKTAVLRYADPLPIDTLDPQEAPGAGDYVWIFPAYDRLIDISPTGQLIPGLATSWAFSPDGKTFTMTLRSGVTFDDGTPFNAQAVVDTINRGKTDPKSSVAGDLAAVSSVKAIDSTHVQFTLSAPDSSLPYTLAQGAGCIVSPKAIADGQDLATTPDGVGMYKVASYVPSQTATYVANPGYWNPKAIGASKMVFTTITSSAQRLNALKTGSVNVTFLDGSDVSSAQAAGLTVAPFQSTEFYHLQLNRSRTALSNPLVRQALNYAINRQALVSGLLFGQAQINEQPFPKSDPSFDAATGTTPYSYNPNKARSLLTQAGYPHGFTFTAVTENDPSYVQVAQAIAQQLAAVGITMKIVQTPNVAVTFYVNDQYDATFVQFYGRPDPAQTIQELFTPSGFANPGKNSDPTVESLYSQVEQTTNTAKRDQLLQQLSAQVTKQAMDVILYFPNSSLTSTSNVVGLQQWSDGILQFNGVGVKG